MTRTRADLFAEFNAGVRAARVAYRFHPLRSCYDTNCPDHASQLADRETRRRAKAARKAKP